MKKIFLMLALAVSLAANAQTAEPVDKYLAGAVTTNEAGFVTFTQDYKAEGKSAGELMKLLTEYTQKEVVEGKDHLEKSRITETDNATGVIAASVEEYLYFKRKAWTMDRVRFTYQLIYHVKDGAFSIEMRNLRYQYDDVPNAEVYVAEKWITDEEALSKDKKKLTRIGGKFRLFTIKRKDAVFAGAAAATGATPVEK